MQKKPGTPSFAPSKTIITSWLKSIFSDMPLSAKIEDFGDGVIYCRLLNHYYGNPPHSKITWSPKNQYEYANNLKHVQNALLQLGISIPFDVNRVCKRKFLENWSLINSFYKHFNSGPDQALAHQQSLTSHLSNQIHHQFQNNQINITPSFASTSNNHHLQAKSYKRPHAAVGQYSEIQHLNQKAQQMNQNNNLANFTSPIIVPQPTSWEPNVANFSNLAHSSLQMTQFLKENVNIYNNSPAKGKWSVGSNMFQINNNAVIDRVKQILLKGSHDTQKIKQIKMLLGLPIEEEEVIKIQDDDGVGPIIYKKHDEKQDQKVQKVVSIENGQKQDKEKIAKAMDQELRQKKEKQVKQVREIREKQSSQLIQKEMSSKEAKISISKGGLIRKPFKI